MNSEYPLIDEHGKRYRIVGSSKEYEPVMLTSHGTVTQSQLQSINQNQTKRVPELLKLKREPVKNCPFKVNMYNIQCNTNCTWWNGSECLLRTSGATSEGVKNKMCPVSHRKCSEACALLDESDNCLLLKKLKGD